MLEVHRGPPGGATTAPPEADPGGGRKRWRKRSLRVLGVLVVVGLAAFGLRGRLPAWGDVSHAVAAADLWWFLVAALLQVVSIGAFTLQQRGLLGALGVRIGRGHTFAIVLASTAMSISLPAGPVVSAAYAVRRFQRAGATPEAATGVMVVSGLASIGGVAALYAGVGLVFAFDGPGKSVGWRPLAVVAGLLVVTVAMVLVGRRYWGRAPIAVADRGSAGAARRYLLMLLGWIRSAWHSAAALTWLAWAGALAWSTAKWVADLLSFLAVAHAFQLPVSLPTLTAVYISVQVVRQVPLTPGGIGVVELALTAGLTAAGASSAVAAADVLIYRVLSCWLLIPVGGIAAWLLVRPPRQAALRP
ncbi:hypothetical protein DFJ67_7525 [Asanoa ferruginea]|uniref:Lysylphosphatidylglycerol synthase-like protein n=1 Tax=Asanoa ferruginea TaxID=53367 RepID=A0A3E0A4Y2_9ACTN|nr:YbhN family protein [Asanoa ferruginea]REG01441.1 hypothetical protein DFJ67_7525 [Asanoa ferruginea]GIF47932.1 hypothetical protein Afe04nite_24710 [Asanoa ferruginea]